MQAALDPLTFPGRSQRRCRGGGGGGGDARGSGMEPPGIVLERFDSFTRHLSAAFGVTRGHGGGVSEVGGQRPPPPIDADVAGVFEKRLVRFEPAQLAALSSEEAQALERVLDLQSVVAHCGALWTSALVTSGPECLPDREKARIKERVVKLAHNSIKFLGRFLPEVFPRQERQQPGRGGHGASASRERERRSGDRSRAGLPPACYGSAFRRLYGPAAYAVAAFLLRVCGGGMLKGAPLCDLVKTFFEGLTALAVMHLPDLLQCFSGTSMVTPPVTGWIKNINDRAIHGGAPASAPLPSSSSSSPLPGNASANAAASTPLLASLASALRGDLAYPSPVLRTRDGGRGSRGERGGAFSDLAAMAALAPPPCRDPGRRSRCRDGLRREMLGDRKLRVARFVMEAASAEVLVSVRKTRHLLALLTGVPPLSMKKDILPLVRPVYSLLGEALLGEKGLARRLTREALGVATALARRVAECFAEVVVLAVATNLGTVLASVTARGDEGCGLEDLGPRESALEQLIVSQGAWDSHGAGRGWPHSSVPELVEVRAGGEEGIGAEQGAADTGEEGGNIALPDLVEEAERMVSALRSAPGVSEGSGPAARGVLLRRLEEVLLPRMKACRDYCGQPRLQR
ncbi:unnamed protein product [Scytosiphon promiscuus]